VPEGSLHDQDRAWDRKLRYAHHQEEIAAFRTAAGGEGG